MIKSTCILALTLMTTVLIGNNVDNSPQGLTNNNHELSAISAKDICIPPFCRKDKTSNNEID